MSSHHVCELLVSRLGSPSVPLLRGQVGDVSSLPNNVICFQRARVVDLNGNQQGDFLHHRFTLILALRGRVPVVVDGQTRVLGAGAGLLIFPFQFHHYLAAERKSIRWLFVTFELADATALARLRDRLLHVNGRALRAACDLLRAYQDPGVANLVVLRLALLLQHLQAAESGGSERESAGKSGDRHGWWRGAQGQLARDPLSMNTKEMACKLGVSVSHLRSQFHISTGVSLGRHLRRMRMERACGLLQSRSHRVTEIAEWVGFSSVYVFSRAFRREFGVSPLGYRRRLEQVAGRRSYV